MIQKKILLIFLFQGLLFSSQISAQTKLKSKWSVPAHLPENKILGKQPGLAGAFIGVIHEKLIIAGGANFPDRMPWEGGKKVYWDDIYVLSKNKKGKYTWENNGEFKLMENIAYGASVITKNGIVCIGGENETGISKKVFLLNVAYQGKKIDVLILPELPIPLTNLSAASVNSVIYAAGGETIHSVSKKFFKLDLDKAEQGWTELTSIPVEVSHAILIKQLKNGSPYLYLAGGRKKNINGVSEFYSTLFEYNIEKDAWVKKATMPYAISAAAGVSFGHAGILIIGGDKGETFQKTESLISAINAEKEESKKHLLISEKNNLQQHHPGFSRSMLMYDVNSDNWNNLGEIPFEVPVTTTAVWWDRAIFLPTGEIKAGVRTTQILKYK